MNRLHYDATFKCTYQLFTDKNDNDLSDDLYRSQFLQAFKLNEWNDEDINKRLIELQNKLEQNENGIIILNTIKENVKIPIDNIEIILLCSFDYFYLFHNCIVDLFIYGYISKQTMDSLIFKIKQN